jgi:reactive intermediate/imine deaminase
MFCRARRAWRCGLSLRSAYNAGLVFHPRRPARMTKQIIHTDQAPAAIGPYSQAVRAGNTVYFSGQIPLDPATGNLVEGDITAQARRSFDNLKAVAEAAGGSLGDIVRLGLYLTDLGQFASVNAVMQEYFVAPFPARSTIEVSGLPKGALFEVDAVMVLGG